METVDVTPTWPEAAQILLAGIEHGTGEGKRIAREEIMRMAEIAQKYVDLQGTTTMKKGTRVFMSAPGFEGEGVTIENEAGVIDSYRRVIRVRWSDGSESIENVKHLIELPKETDH